MIRPEQIIVWGGWADAYTPQEIQNIFGVSKRPLEILKLPIRNWMKVKTVLWFVLPVQVCQRLAILWSYRVLDIYEELFDDGLARRAITCKVSWLNGLSSLNELIPMEQSMWDMDKRFRSMDPQDWEVYGGFIAYLTINNVLRTIAHAVTSVDIDENMFPIFWASQAMVRSLVLNSKRKDYRYDIEKSEAEFEELLIHDLRRAIVKRKCIL